MLLFFFMHSVHELDTVTHYGEITVLAVHQQGFSSETKSHFINNKMCYWCLNMKSYWENNVPLSTPTVVA
jgi:hypothetical protein